MMPGVVQLGSQPYLVPRNSGFLDSFADFGLIAIGKGGINVAVAYLKSMLDSFSDDIGRALPGSEADGGDLIAGVEGKGFSDFKSARGRVRRSTHPLGLFYSGTHGCVFCA